MKKKIRYLDILPNKQEWPIVQFSKHRKAFVQEVTDLVFSGIGRKEKNFHQRNS